MRAVIEIDDLDRMINSEFLSHHQLANACPFGLPESSPVIPPNSIDALSNFVACLEPISKLSEQDNEAGELNKAQKVLGVVFPSNEDATPPLYPCEEAFYQPASLVSPQPPSILGLHFAVGTVGAIISTPSCRNSWSNASLS